MIDATALEREMVYQDDKHYHRQHLQPVRSSFVRDRQRDGGDSRQKEVGKRSLARLLDF